MTPGVPPQLAASSLRVSVGSFRGIQDSTEFTDDVLNVIRFSDDLELCTEMLSESVMHLVRQEPPKIQLGRVIIRRFDCTHTQENDWFRKVFSDAEMEATPRERGPIMPIWTSATSTP
ncbi:MAG TPA: hypothetical protein VFI42_21020 [Thermomicrobiaceae bacterium]|nr:hypothetical protein [Thermomicrobiaceae bacterium]